MKTDLFQSWGHCWVFQICWHIECSTYTASSFRMWSSSAGIPSPPLALFIVMLSKAHLTSHSRMCGSRWVTTPSWFSGSWRSFLPQYHWAFTHFKAFVLWLLQNGQRYVSPTSNQTNSTILFQHCSIWPSGGLVLSRNAGPFQLLVGEHPWKMGSEAACLKCCHQISLDSVLIPGERQVTLREALIMLVFISCICTNVWMNDWRTEQVCLREESEETELTSYLPRTSSSLTLGTNTKEVNTVAACDVLTQHLCCPLSIRKNCALSDSGAQHSVAHDGKSTDSLLLSESILSMLMGPGGNNISQF